MTCYCFLRGVTDVMKDGFTPYKSKFLKDFKGEKILLVLNWNTDPAHQTTVYDCTSTVIRPSQVFSSATTKEPEETGVEIT